MGACCVAPALVQCGIQGLSPAAVTVTLGLRNGIGRMYTIIIEARFCAKHRVRLPDGTLEEFHSHDWIVLAYFSRAELDDTGMVMDYHKARAGLESVLAPLHGANLNDTEALAGANPTAEVLAGHVFQSLRAYGFSSTCKVEITEAPGCIATFEPAEAIAGGGSRKV